MHSNPPFSNELLHRSRHLQKLAMEMTSTIQPQFDARRYLKERYQSPEQRGPPLKYCFSFFNKYHINWDPTKAVLLELGGGPSLQIAITAAPFVANIVHSDFEASCNKEVQLWVDRSPDAFSWTPVAEYAMKHCELVTESEVDLHAVTEREEELRRKISAVTHCDVNKENVGLAPAVIPDGGFDVVVACGCLTPAVRTQEEFVKSLKNIHGVMKEGGYLCALIAGKLTTYKVAPDCKEQYEAYYVTDKEVREGIADAGLHLKEFEIKEPIRGHAVATPSSKELYCCIIKK